MKQGKKPTREQMEIMQRFGFKPTDWLVSKNTSDELLIVCRYTNQMKSIPKSLF